MDAEIKKRWVEALRSGKYKQGRGALKKISPGEKNPRYCCLGVLCDIYAQDKSVPWIQYDTRKPIFEILGRQGIPPIAVSEWAGMGSGDPSVDGFDLSYHNDTRRKTFPQIADLIEKHL